MNICPGCEKEIEAGLALCEACTEGDVEAASGSEGTRKGESPVACLELEDGRRFDIGGGETLIGRSDPVDQIEPDVDLSFFGGFEQGVSRRHALILMEESGYVLEDLGSTNGTVVNREKVMPGKPVSLSEGDVIHLGNMKAVFHADTGEGGAS